MCLKLPVFSQATVPFACDEKLYFFRYADSALTGAVKYLSYIDNYTTIPTVTDVCLIEHKGTSNALAANAKDGFLYYAARPDFNTPSTIYRLDANCNTTQLFTIPLIEARSGAFDHMGRYWILDPKAGDQKLSALDITTGDTVKGPFNIGGQIDDITADIAFNYKDCKFYTGVLHKTFSIDTNGVVTAVNSGFFGPYYWGAPGSGTFGGVVIGIDGDLYGMTNGNTKGTDSSGLYKYNLAKDSAEGPVIKFTPSASGSAGADMANFSCSLIQSNISANVTATCDSFPIQFNNTSSGFIDTYYWDFGDGDVSSQKNPSHIYSSSGKYTAKLIASFSGSSCYPIDPDTSYINLDLKDSCKTKVFIHIPNVFTPNQDGINDNFFISTIGYQTLICTLYDRWGNKLTEWDAVSASWNGILASGTKATEGVYYYVLNGLLASDEKYNTTGFVQLLR